VASASSYSKLATETTHNSCVRTAVTAIADRQQRPEAPVDSNSNHAGNNLLTATITSNSRHQQLVFTATSNIGHWP